MERLDDLQYEGLMLYQDTDGACFTEDSVLLANFFRARPGARAIDLMCGGGVIAALASKKTGAVFAGVDSEARSIELARRSAAYNGQDIDFRCMPVSDAPAAFGHGSFDLAVMNPPYFTEGERSENRLRAAARHADGSLLGEALRAAFLLLKNRGDLYLCYPAARLADLICALRDARLEPKLLHFAISGSGQAYLALVRAKKLGAPGLSVE